MKRSLRLKLDQLESRLGELNHLLAAENATRDMERYRTLSREHAEIDPIVALFRQYTEAEADRMAMSARNFARVFAQELGTTPGRYLLQLRVEAARRLLEQTDQSSAHVATACGFGSVDVMRRVFLRALGTTPLRYRRHFQTEAARSRMPSKALRGPLVAARREIARAARVAAGRRR